MTPLNFPEYSFKTKTENGSSFIFDAFRKKWVVLTPEEWVRQHVLCFLTEEKKYPASLIETEKQIELNELKKRCDIIVNNNNGIPKMIVECKAPSVNITQQTFDQAIRYNMVLNVPFLLLTNGLKHYCFELKNNHEPVILKQIPEYKAIREE